MSRIILKVLLMLELVKKGQTNIPNLHQWGTIALSEDWELEKILDKGIADTHIHLGGCGPLLWQRIMNKEISELEKLSRYFTSRQRHLAENDILEYQKLMDFSLFFLQISHFFGMALQQFLF